MLRVGIIGTGLIAHSHAQGVKDNSASAKITAVCDINPKQIEKFLADTGLTDVKTYTDYREMIESEDLDLVSICTSNCTHKEIAVFAAEHKKNILCEKPVGLDSAEVSEIAEACRKNQVINLTGFTYRRIPAVAEIKKIIDQGLLGRIYHYRGRFYADRMAAPDHEIEWRHKENEAGSGTLGDLGSHLLDMGLYLLSGQCHKVTDVYADARIYIPERKNLDTGEMEKVTSDDCCDIIAHFEDGTEMNLETTRYAPFEVEFHITGEKGAIRYNLLKYDEFELMLYSSPANYFHTYRTVTVDSPVICGKKISTDRMSRQYAYLLNCIKNGEKAHPDIGETVYIQQLLDAMKQSYKEERKIFLSQD